MILWGCFKHNNIHVCPLEPVFYPLTQLYINYQPPITQNHPFRDRNNVNPNSVSVNKIQIKLIKSHTILKSTESGINTHKIKEVIKVPAKGTNGSYE